ncbi:uncharacterized protein [Clytia hemisphaerica]|uniref:uncharacterized protein n=1 Tax=Clytia hemisphaerica TaxID=252671 RepID=UPI0034D67691
MPREGRKRRTFSLEIDLDRLLQLIPLKNRNKKSFDKIIWKEITQKYYNATKPPPDHKVKHLFREYIKSIDKASSISFAEIFNVGESSEMLQDGTSKFCEEYQEQIEQVGENCSPVSVPVYEIPKSNDDIDLPIPQTSSRTNEPYEQSTERVEELFVPVRETTPESERLRNVVDSLDRRNPKTSSRTTKSRKKSNKENVILDRMESFAASVLSKTAVELTKYTVERLSSTSNVKNTTHKKNDIGVKNETDADLGVKNETDVDLGVKNETDVDLGVKNETDVDIGITESESSSSSASDIDQSECPKDSFFLREISSTTANLLTSAQIPKSGVFTYRLKQKSLREKLSNDWQKLRIIQSDNSTYRRFENKYKELLFPMVKKHNEYCSLVVNHQRLNNDQSKKKSSTPYWICHLRCKRPECNFSAKVSIMKEDCQYATLLFDGKVSHDIRKTSADIISGRKRKSEHRRFEKNLKTPPSKVYGEKLAKIKSTVFAAGNREEAGRSPKIYQKIKSEVRSPNTKKAFLHEKVQQVASKIENEDRAKAQEQKQARKFYGYVHDVMVDKEVRITLTTEGLIRLYHEKNYQDIVYLDATGSVTLPLKECKRILLYSLCVRHPYGLAPPLPIAQYLSSSHSVPSIRRFLMSLQEKEKLVFNKISRPSLILVDYSVALIVACVNEFCGESLPEYINRTFRIVNGLEDNLMKTLLHICFSHITKRNKYVLKKLKSPKKAVSLAMHWFSRLTECRFLAELEELVKLGQIVFMTPTTDVVNYGKTVHEAVEEIERSIGQFPHIQEILKDTPNAENPKDEENENTLASIEADEDDFLASIEETKKTKTGSNQPLTELSRFWDNALSGFSVQTATNEEINNEFYAPSYFNFVMHYRLPTATLWTGLCLGNLTRFRANNQEEQQPSASKSIMKSNTTTAQVEGYFSNLKRLQGLNQPIPEFIENTYRDLHWQQRQFYDMLVHGQDKFVLERTPKINNEDFIPRKAPKVEEGWNKKTKRTDVNEIGIYRSARKKTLTFPEKKKSEDTGENYCAACGEDRVGSRIKCSICRKSYHSECTGTDVNYGKVCLNFICAPCVRCRFLPFADYMAFKNSEETSIEVLDFLWNRKTKEERDVIKQISLPKKLACTLDIKRISCSGIINPLNNCWMSTVLQVVCGSTLFDFLSSICQPENEIFKHLVVVNEKLQNVNQPLEVQSNGALVDWTALTQLVSNIRLSDHQQCCEYQFYFDLICKLNSDCPALTEYFFIRVAELNTCNRCNKIYGNVSAHPSLHVSVFKTSQRMTLDSLIRHACFGHPPRTWGNNSFCECPVMFHQTSTILNAPSILVVSINRGHVGKNVKVIRSRVIIERHLQFKLFCASSLEGVSYNLFAMINHTGKTVNAGHFTVTFFDERIVTINDTKIYIEDEENFLGSYDVESTVSTLFYVREDTGSDRQPLNFHTTEEEKREVERVWLGEEGHAELNGIRTEEFRSLIPNKCLKGDVINGFLQAISYGRDDIHVFNSHVYTSIESGRSSVHLNPENYEDILSKRQLILPIHHSHNHWSIIVIYFLTKQIHHLDSLLIVNPEIMSSVFSFVKHLIASVLKKNTTKEEWLFVSRADIDLQEGVVDCGVYACINALNTIDDTFLKLTKEDCGNARYFIASKILTSKHPEAPLRKNKNRQETKSIVVDVDIIREADIHITTKHHRTIRKRIVKQPCSRDSCAAPLTTKIITDENMDPKNDQSSAFPPLTTKTITDENMDPKNDQSSAFPPLTTKTITDENMDPKNDQSSAFPPLTTKTITDENMDPKNDQSSAFHPLATKTITDENMDRKNDQSSAFRK